MYDELKVSSDIKINRLFFVLLLVLLLIFAFNFFEPLTPVQKENILIKKSVYEKFDLEKNKK